MEKALLALAVALLAGQLGLAARHDRRDLDEQANAEGDRARAAEERMQAAAARKEAAVRDCVMKTQAERAECGKSFDDGALEEMVMNSEARQIRARETANKELSIFCTETSRRSQKASDASRYAEASNLADSALACVRAIVSPAVFAEERRILALRQKAAGLPQTATAPSDGTAP